MHRNTAKYEVYAKKMHGIAYFMAVVLLLPVFLASGVRKNAEMSKDISEMLHKFIAFHNFKVFCAYACTNTLSASVFSQCHGLNIHIKKSRYYFPLSLFPLFPFSLHSIRP